MSRAHERAYNLLAERVRLGTPARRALYATVAALALSGVWWIGVHFAGAWLAPSEDDLPRLAREAFALKIHGAAAFAILLRLPRPLFRLVCGTEWFVEAGAACSFTFYTVDQSFQLFDLGFRCCSDAAPSPGVRIRMTSVDPVTMHKRFDPETDLTLIDPSLK